MRDFSFKRLHMPPDAAARSGKSPDFWSLAHLRTRILPLCRAVRFVARPKDLAMQNRAYAYLLLTMLFWGGNAVAGKLAVGHISPMMLVTLRWVLAVGILAAIGWRQFLADWPVMRRHLVLLCVLGTCGFTFFNALFYTALTYTTAINVSIEQAGMPVLVILINFLLFRLRVAWLQLVGVIVTIAGVAITACHGDPRQLLALGVNVGDGMMLIAVVLYSGYTVFLRFKPNIHWKTLMLALAFFSFVTALPFAAWEIATGRAIYPDLEGWAIAWYVALFPSALSQILYIRSNEMIGGNRAALFINLVPIFGTLLSVVLIGEKFQSYHALAIVLVLGGIWLAEHSGRRLAARTPA